VLAGNHNASEDKKLVPTIVVDPQLDSPLMKDEIFGPILPIVTINNIDEAIKFINERDKPLTLYYFGPVNGSNRHRVERETSSGGFSVNEVLF
jgi:aldehyde dehydrogenase (NAD+)